MNDKKRLIIAISGASGIIYGIRLLQLLKEFPLETHLVVSESAERTRIEETSFSRQDLKDLATICYSYHDIGAAIASGSFKTMGMIIAPCSMRSLAEIANGIGSNLISRAADVVLKERRRLVLMVRESPLHAVHLKNMLAVTEMGGVIAPPVPAFYNKPQTLTDIIDHSLGRTLDLFDFDLKIVKRWGEKRRTAMTRGDKSKYSSKQKRQAEHIEEGYEKRGLGKKESQRRAWATVNKQTGGAKGKS